MSFTPTIGIPWSYRGWSAGGVAPADPGTTVTTTPDPDRGVVVVAVEWPGATVTQLVRVHPDGSLHPVRGAYPMAMGSIRYNLATNPSFEVSTADWVVYNAGTTLSRIGITPLTLPTPPGTWALWLTCATAGDWGATHSIAVTAGQYYTASCYVYLTVSRDVRVYLEWLDSTGGVISTDSVTTASVPAAAWTRVAINRVAPANAATVKFSVVGRVGAFDDQFIVEAVLIEQSSSGAAAGAYFDGDTPGHSWDATAHLSRSSLPGLATVDDGEAPLDVPLHYIATNPALTGGQETTDTPITLDSDHRTWLTHPATPGVPFTVSVRRKPTLDRPIQQGVFRPINRRFPVVVSAAERQAPEGTLEFNALSAADRTQLLEVFRDGSPLLIRSPAVYNYDPQWVSLATITEDPEGRLAYQDAWLLSAPFVEVDEPTVLV